MLLTIYLAVKFALYYSVCYWALALFKIPAKNKNTFAMKWALIRMLIGFMFGFLMIYSTALLSQSGLPLFGLYFLVFGVIRLLEWLLVAWLMAGLYEFDLIAVRSKLIKWVLLGVVISMTLDLGLLALGEEYKFGIC